MAKLGCWLSRATRDQEFKAAKAAGMNVIRRTASSQVISCDYVEDCDGAHSAPNNFGGRAPTFHAKLYIIDEGY